MRRDECERATFLPPSETMDRKPEKEDGPTLSGRGHVRTAGKASKSYPGHFLAPTGGADPGLPATAPPCLPGSPQPTRRNDEPEGLGRARPRAARRRPRHLPRPA